eukprot:COSAG05_NODE_527_length_8917_cov_523.108415_2_plen_2332_part_00
MQTSQGSRGRGGNKQHARGGGGGGGGRATFAGYVFLCNPKTEGECFGRGLFGAGGGKMRDMERIKPQTRLFLRNFKTNQLYGWFRGTAPAGLNIQPGAWAPSVNNPSPFPAQIPIEAPDGRRSCALPSELQACRLEGGVATAMVDQLMSLLRTSGVPATAALLAPPVSHICWQWSDGADWVDYSAQLCRKLEISFSRHSSGSTSQRTTSQRGGDICGLVDVGGGRHVDVSTMTQLVTNNQSRRRAVRRVDDSTQRELSSQASVREVTAIEAAATQASEQASRQRRLAEQQRLEAQYRTLEKGKARKQQAAEEARRLREEAEAAEAAEKRRREEVLAGGLKRGDQVFAAWHQDGGTTTSYAILIATLASHGSKKASLIATLKYGDQGTVVDPGVVGGCLKVRFGAENSSGAIYLDACEPGVHVLSRDDWQVKIQREQHAAEEARRLREEADAAEAAEKRRREEVLAGGLKRGDQVFAAYPDGGTSYAGLIATLKYGDQGTVVDPGVVGGCLKVRFGAENSSGAIHLDACEPGVHVLSRDDWQVKIQREQEQRRLQERNKKENERVEASDELRNDPDCSNEALFFHEYEIEMPIGSGWNGLAPKATQENKQWWKDKDDGLSDDWQVKIEREQEQRRLQLWRSRRDRKHNERLEQKRLNEEVLDGGFKRGDTVHAICEGSHNAFLKEQSAFNWPSSIKRGDIGTVTGRTRRYTMSGMQCPGLSVLFAAIGLEVGDCKPGVHVASPNDWLEQAVILLQQQKKQLREEERTAAILLQQQKKQLREEDRTRRMNAMMADGIHRGHTMFAVKTLRLNSPVYKGDHGPVLGAGTKHGLMIDFDGVTVDNCELGEEVVSKADWAQQTRFIGGLKFGDIVFAGWDQADGSVRYGMRGRVTGGDSIFLDRNAKYVDAEFEKADGGVQTICKLEPARDLIARDEWVRRGELVLAGDFRRGDTVFWAQDAAVYETKDGVAITIRMGDIGTVCDPGTISGPEHDQWLSHLYVYWEAQMARVKCEAYNRSGNANVRNIVSREIWKSVQKEAEEDKKRARTKRLKKLKERGYRKGETVVAAHEITNHLANCKLHTGDTGTVAGYKDRGDDDLAGIVVMFEGVGEIICTVEDVLPMSEWELRQKQETQIRRQRMNDMLANVAQHCRSESWEEPRSEARRWVGKIPQDFMGRVLLDMFARGQPVQDFNCDALDRLWTLSMQETWISDGPNKSQRRPDAIDLMVLASGAVGDTHDEMIDRTTFVGLCRHKSIELAGNRSQKFKDFLTMNIEHAHPVFLDYLADLLDLDTGRSAAHIAVQATISANKSDRPKHLEFLKQLAGLQHIDMALTDSDGATCLHYACDDSDLAEDMVPVLLSGCPADIVQLINLQRRTGETALHLACENALVKTVECLLDHGADPRITDKMRHKPRPSGKNQEKKAMQRLMRQATEKLEKSRSARKPTKRESRDASNSVRDRQIADTECAKSATPLVEAQAQPPSPDDEELENEKTVPTTVTIPRNEHIIQLIAGLKMAVTATQTEDQPSDPSNNVEDWKEGIAPLDDARTAVEEATQANVVADVACESTSSPEPEADDLGLNYLQELPFEFECRKEAANQISRLDKVQRKSFLQRMHRAGSAEIGSQNDRLWHRIKSTPPGLALYSTSFFDNSWRVLWELSPEYSARRSSAHAQSSEGLPKPRWVDTIRIWSVSNHDDYEDKIPEVMRCYKEGRTCIRRMRKQLVRIGSVASDTGGRIRQPFIYELQGNDLQQSSDEDDDQADLEETERAATVTAESKDEQAQLVVCPPADVVDDSRCLVKFYTMNEAFCSLIIRGILSEKLQFPFKTDQLEDAIIHAAGNQAVLLIGRSGTGKTTIAMNRMWVKWNAIIQSPTNTSSKASALPSGSMWHSVFVTANRVLLTSVRDVFRNMQLGVQHTGVRILPEKVVIPSSLSPTDVTEDSFPMFISAQSWLELLDATLCDPTLEAKEAELEEAKRDLSQAMEALKQMRSLDLEEAACQQQKDALKQLPLLPSELSAKQAVFDDNLNQVKAVRHKAELLIQHCRQRAKDLQEVVDSTSKPFVAIDGTMADCDSGGMLHEQRVWQHEVFNFESLSRNASVPRHEAEAGQSKSIQSQRAEVTHDIFERKFWRELSLPFLHHYSPSTTWIEIISYIKGSLASLLTDCGHMSRAEYENMGIKIGNFGNEATRSPDTNRSDIYTIFLEYERWKHNSALKMYDRMDRVYDIWRRLKLMGYHGVPIHSLSIDEVQDFTQAEICLYLKVCDNPNDVLLAGDTCQTIARGVGFRFQDLRSMFHEFKKGDSRIQQVPQLTALTTNYRTHNGILRAAAVSVISR